MGIESSVQKLKPFSSTPVARNFSSLSHDQSILNGSNANVSAEVAKSHSSMNGNHSKLKTYSSHNRPAAYKTIFVEVVGGVRVPIKFDAAEQDRLTCGWLVSEAVKVLAQNNLFKLDPAHPLMALQTVDGSITLNYWLSIPERSLAPLKDGLVLKPFYGDNDYKIEGQKISLSYFDCIKLIGSGGFSKVYLVKRKDTGKFYALKVIRKEEIVGEKQRRSVLNEREIFARIHHPFLSRLHFAFQTTGQLCFVMDFFPGGELFYHLHQRKKFSEEQAKVYVAEIILALHHLHKNNIMYRDIKPENILLDIDGHLHLTDFGLSKISIDHSELNYSFCGSPEYLAPEVILNTGYTYSVDYYGLGVLVYEMIFGRTPFTTNSQEDLFHQITHNKVSLTGRISSKLKSFLAMLLQKNPKERLGAKGEFDEIINHPWCKDIDFASIASKKIRPPVQPDLYKSNFDEGFIDKEISLEDENYLSIPSGSGDSVHSDPEEIKEVMDHGNIDARFPNFSFYSNVDDQPVKATSFLLPGLGLDGNILQGIDDSRNATRDYTEPIKNFTPKLVSSGNLPKKDYLSDILQSEEYEDDSMEEKCEQPLSNELFQMYATQSKKSLSDTGMSPASRLVGKRVSDFESTGIERPLAETIEKQ